MPESLAALVLVSVVVLGLAGGMFTFLRATGATSEAQRAQAELTRVAETVKAAAFQPCTSGGDPAATYRTVVESQTGISLPSGSVRVEHLSLPDSGPGAFSLSCPPIDRVQRVRLSHAGVMAQVVKRDDTRGAEP